MIKDGAGNTLAEGDFVMCRVDAMLRMKVMKITEPGILVIPETGKKAEIGSVVLIWVTTEPFAKGQERLPNVYKNPDPAEQAKVDEILSKAADANIGAVPIPINKHN